MNENDPNNGVNQNTDVNSGSGQNNNADNAYTYAADSGTQNGGYDQYNYNNPNQPQPPQSPPGYGQAIASMVLGIIAVVFWFFGWSAIVSVVLGIIGVVLASKSKALGYNGPIRTAGFVLSIIGLAGGVVFFISCVACVGCITAAGNAYGGLEYLT